MKYFSEKERIDKEERVGRYPEYIRNLYYSIYSIHDYYDEHLKPLCGPETILLDAGCGKKGIMGLYKSKCRLSVGIDLSLSAIKENRCLDVFAVSELTSIPFQAEIFDIIISAWTVEHLENPMLVFQEFYRILKPKGHLILITNSVYNPVMFLSAVLPQGLRDKIKRKWYPPVIDEDTFPTYYRCNSLNKMDKVLQKAGFAKVMKSYAGDTSLFLFSKLFPLFLFYERITDFLPFRRFKFHIFCHYVKQ